MTSLDVCKMKVYYSQKIGVKVRNFLTSGFEIYAISFECLVNKLSQIPDVNSGTRFIRHIVAQIR